MESVAREPWKAPGDKEREIWATRRSQKFPNICGSLKNHKRKRKAASRVVCANTNSIFLSFFFVGYDASWVMTKRNGAFSMYILYDRWNNPAIIYGVVYHSANASGGSMRWLERRAWRDVSGVAKGRRSQLR